MTREPTEDELAQLEAIRQASEPLDGHLKPLLRHTEDFGFMLHGPFCVILGVDPSGVNPVNALANQTYRHTMERYERALREGDLYRAIFTVTRPYRAHVFAQHMNDMPDATYWRLLGEVWIDAENPPEDPDSDFAWWFRSTRPGRVENLMYFDEREVLHDAPDEITIYRGGGPNDEVGLAWSLSRDVAAWFAKRFEDDPDRQVVFERTVPKSFVLAYFDRRGEQEIILDPRYWRA